MQEIDFDLGQALEADHPHNNLYDRLVAYAGMDLIDREVERKHLSKEFNIRVSIIDSWLAGYQREQATGTSEIVSEIEPAIKSVDGAELLTTIKENLTKHVILPGGVVEPIAAWIVLTYCHEAFRILPLLGIVSPVKRCGKTTLLEILQAMANKALTTSNISPAAVFRTIEKYSPTLLVDEADTFLKDNDELRGVLNSGHTRASAFVIRVEGDEHQPVKFSTWGPKAISMISTTGMLPDTLQDRAVVICLRRKTPGEVVLRIGVDFAGECLSIRRACRRWADDNLQRLKAAKPDIPVTNNDRVVDNWMPLLAIADVVGGGWPELMRRAMLGMIDGADDSIGPKLLRDIRNIFQDKQSDRMFSDDLCEALKEREESPWLDWRRGKGLTPNGLARLLQPFDIRSKTMRIYEDRRKGYELSSFNDAFKRYIPSTPPVSTVATGHINNISDLGEKQSVTNINDVTDDKQRNLLNLNECHDVTDEKRDTGEGKEKAGVPLWKQLNFESEAEYLKIVS